MQIMFLMLCLLLLLKIGIPVSISSLKSRLQDKELYTGSCSSLCLVLKQLGFSYKADDNRRYLMEQPHVVHLRYNFLKSYLANEALGDGKKPYVFLDETWIFQNGSVRKSWQDEDIRSVKRRKGDGGRYIILHAGTEKGFIEGASLIFKSGHNKGDYHSEMNSKCFEQWLENDLLPALQEPSIVIMDNASYHSRQLNKLPTKSLKKDDMKFWLRERNIGYPECATKDMLWDLINKQPMPDKSFVTDSLIQNAGHEVLRLPPYHCQFNAIEMVWSQAKRFYDSEVLTNKDPLDTWKKAIQNVRPDQWENYVRHTDKVIKSAWEKDKHIISNQSAIVITLGDEDILESDSD